MIETRSRAVDHLGFIRRTLGELTGYERLTFELIQNADDTKRAKRLRFDVRDEALWVEDDGGFRNCGNQKLSPDDCLFLGKYGHRCDFHSFRLVSGADKRLREDTTGAFGIGFTAVYQVTDRPEIISGELHWRVDETASEDGRIRENRLDTRHEGTRIILPWARDKNSEFRRRVEVSTVSENIEEELIESLEASVVSAMLFLRNLQTIEIARNGEVVRSVTRKVDGVDGQTVLLDDGDETRRWRLLEGDFEDEAMQLRVEHMRQLDLARKAKVEIAIPVGFEVDGRLCSTLPTEKSIGLPVHVNGELYLTSDRRQLEMGTPHHSAWNSAIIEAAGRLLAESLHVLPELLGPRLLWKTLESARNLFRDMQADALSQALASFWEQLEPEIPHYDLVWTSKKRWEKVSVARFVQYEEDVDAFQVLEDLGITLVHPSLRTFQNTLRDQRVGVKLLDFQHIASGLRQAGLARSTPLEQIPAPLNSPTARKQLWEQLGRMLDRRRSGDLESVKEVMEGAAIVPSTDGQLCPAESLWYAEQRSVDLLSAVAPEFPFLDSEQLRGEAKPLVRLCDELTPSGAVLRLSGEELEVDVSRARDLIGWMSQREDELKPRDLDLLKGLQIFPSSNGVHLLRDVALPGDFSDPLKLAQLVDETTAKEHRAFLRRMGAEELSFAVYASVQIPRAFEEGNLSLKQKREIVSLLAREHLRLDEHSQARSALARVPLVECLNGSWQRPSNVYFDNETVRVMLGDRATRARMPQEHRQATETFFRWLGVSDTPRVSDLIARIEEISGKEANEFNRTTVENIVAWLGQGWKELKSSKKDEFARLKKLAWLPERKRKGWQKPSDLDVVFQDYLYESQGRFLNISRQVQRQATDFLSWLEVRRSPRVEQVVAHLHYCAENDILPNLQVYEFLNNNYVNPIVQSLRESKCLHLGSRWCRPDEVYWSEHPFGQWRFQLGQELARYMKLFGKLGVKQSPDYTDAIRVIHDISAEYGERNTHVPDEDLKVLQNCWELCETALRAGDLDIAELVSLGKQKTVVGSDRILRSASHTFFEDLPGLRDEFPHIQNEIIQRPDGSWRAMRAAGVRDLGKVARTRIVDLGDESDEEEMRRWILDREAELARVIAPRLDVPWKTLAEQLRQFGLTVVTRMVIVWELDAFRQHYVGDPKPADALWHTAENTLYVTKVNGGTVWEAVARELVRALLPDIEPATLALGVAAALRPQSREEAQRTLDAAGYAVLAPEISAVISSTQIAEMGVIQDDSSIHESEDGDQANDDRESNISSGDKRSAKTKAKTKTMPATTRAKARAMERVKIQAAL